MGPRITEWLVTGERPTLPPYLAPFAAKASGGKSKKDDEEEEDEDDEDEDDEEDDDEEDDPLAGLSEDELREQLKKTQADLKRDRDRAARRRKREKRERDEAAAKAKAKPKGDDEDDTDERVSAAESKGRAEGLLRAKKAEAKSALLAAGVDPKRVAKATGLIDLDDLDLDDDGLDGIDEAIEELRADWPELFAKGRRKRGAVGGDREASDRSGSKKDLTPSQLQAMAALGRSRR